MTLPYRPMVSTPLNMRATRNQRRGDSSSSAYGPPYQPFSDGRQSDRQGRRSPSRESRTWYSRHPPTTAQPRVTHATRHEDRSRPDHPRSSGAARSSLARPGSSSAPQGLQRSSAAQGLQRSSAVRSNPESKRSYGDLNRSISRQPTTESQRPPEQRRARARQFPEVVVVPEIVDTRGLAIDNLPAPIMASNTVVPGIRGQMVDNNTLSPNANVPLVPLRPGAGNPALTGDNLPLVPLNTGLITATPANSPLTPLVPPVAPNPTCPPIVVTQTPCHCTGLLPPPDPLPPSTVMVAQIWNRQGLNVPPFAAITFDQNGTLLPGYDHPIRTATLTIRIPGMYRASFAVSSSNAFALKGAYGNITYGTTQGNGVNRTVIIDLTYLSGNNVQALLLQNTGTTTVLTPGTATSVNAILTLVKIS
jgi:hypothetical protein